MNGNTPPEDNYTLTALRPTPRRRWLHSAALALLLAVVLVLVSAAVGRSQAEVQNNTFHTGTIKIDLNHGKALFREDEFLLEPGMTLVKPFTLTNAGTWDVYYKLYFAQVEGPLAYVLEVTIADGDHTLYTGRLADLTLSTAVCLNDTLAPGKTRNFTATFYFPPETGNTAQGSYLRFALYADAVQTKNNPHAEFD